MREPRPTPYLDFSPRQTFTEDELGRRYRVMTVGRINHAVAGSLFVNSNPFALTAWARCDGEEVSLDAIHANCAPPTCEICAPIGRREHALAGEPAQGRVPRCIKLLSPKQIGAAPSGSEWIHDVEYDGYRRDVDGTSPEESVRHLVRRATIALPDRSLECVGIGPAYNYLALYINEGLGGARKVRRLMPQAHDSTIRWGAHSDSRRVTR